jgi:nicotinamidase-related amidase
MPAEIITGLKFGPIGAGAIHLCVDMQLMFAVGTKWATPAIWDAVPAIKLICARFAGNTVFTRFICAKDLSETAGQWTRFYAESTSMLCSAMDPAMLGLLPELQEFSPPAAIIDRPVFSAFASPELRKILMERATHTLIISGVETDVCVLATTLSAVDFGYRVILVRDALASSNAEGQQAALNAVFPRFDQQIELIDSETLLNSWQPET